MDINITFFNELIRSPFNCCHSVDVFVLLIQRNTQFLYIFHRSLLCVLNCIDKKKKNFFKLQDIMFLYNIIMFICYNNTILLTVGTCANAVNFQAYLLEGLSRWNADRATAAADTSPSTIRTFDIKLQNRADCLSREVYGSSILPNFRYFFFAQLQILFGVQLQLSNV